MRVGAVGSDEMSIGSLSYYFDYDAFARDLFMCDYFYDNGYVFRR